MALSNARGTAASRMMATIRTLTVSKVRRICRPPADSAMRRIEILVFAGLALDKSGSPHEQSIITRAADILDNRRCQLASNPMP